MAKEKQAEKVQAEVKKVEPKVEEKKTEVKKVPVKKKFIAMMGAINLLKLNRRFRDIHDRLVALEEK